MSMLGVVAFCPEAMEVMKEHYEIGMWVGMYFLLAAPCSVIYLGACADRKNQAEENAKKYTNHN